MNAMSVSPVKPPLNPGSHSVPVTATNLTKPPLPSGNNFTPLNLIPDAKPVPPVAITASPEKSVDLCSKPPTSNGTVFPLPESNTTVCPLPSTQNCVENNETAENLSTNSTQKNVIETAPVEIKPASVVEDKKSDVVKVNLHVKEDSAPARVPAEKEILAQTETATTDVPNNVDDIPVKEEQKEPAVKPIESLANNVDAKPVKVESVPENKKNEAPGEQEKAAESEGPVAVETAVTEPVVEEIPKNTTPKATKRKAKPATESVEDDAIDRKSKRVRLPTQPYQSPIPELQLIAKLNTPTKSTPKNAPERIIAFFKNEFLAVRNPEGSFYICQTFQNIHKSSTKIKIRWFTNLPQDVFTPDFYDTTEFDCILTNVSMTKIEKDRWKLPDHERTRIENILKRALDVEKGVVDQPSVTEEHPDGLDLSLFKDEAQLKKRKKKAASPKKKAPADADAVATPSKKNTAKAVKVTPKSLKKPSSGTKKSPRLTTANQSTAAASDKSKNTAPERKTKKDKKDKKKAKTGAKSTKKTSVAAASVSSKQQSSSDKANSKSWEPSVKASNSSRVVLSLKKENAAKSSSASGAATSATTTSTTTPTSTSSTTTSSSSATATSAEAKSTKRTSSVSLKAGSASLATPSPSQKRRKEEPKPATAASTAAASTTTTTPERTGKVRNAGSAVSAKINSAAMRTTKEKERKSTTPTSAASNQRKK